MGAYDELFATEAKPSASNANVIAPKKNAFFGSNPQIQPSTELSLDEILSNIGNSSTQQKQQTQTKEQGLFSTALQNIFEARKKAQEIAFNAVAPVAEPLAVLATGAQASVIGPLTGIVANVRSGKYGTQEGHEIAKQQAENYAQQTTYQPRTQIGKDIVEGIAEIPEKLTGSHMGVGPLPETYGIMSPAQAAAEQSLTKVGNAATQLQAGYQKLRNQLPTVRIEKNPVANISTQTGLQSGGAAATGIESELKSELARAKPEIQQQFANARPEDFTPENLKVVKNHNQFEKFDMTPTEGQALENAQLMSDEYNARVKDPNIRAAYEQRDQKLIQGFDKIRQEVAPDVFETNEVKLTNAPLEKLVNIDKQSLKNIDQAYKTFFEAGGKESPVDAHTLAKTAIDNLHKNYLYEDAPAAIRNALERHLDGEPMNFEQFSALVKRASTMQRSGGTEAQVGTQLRNALETLPLKGDAIGLKELRDNASNLAKQRYDLIEKVPAYKAAALGDTRDKTQIAQGVPHPASTTFLDKYYGAKTPEVDIRNMLNIIGEGSPEHQALNAALIDKFKKGSGIVDDKGIVKQAALNKQIHELYKSNKGVMFGNKAVIDLEDLADVARKTEPTKGRHSVNTSNTAVVQEQGALQGAKETAKSLAATGAEHGLNVAAKGFPLGTILRGAIKGNNAEKAALAEAKAAEELSKRRLSPTAGIKIKDIGKGK